MTIFFSRRKALKQLAVTTLALATPPLWFCHAQANAAQKTLVLYFSRSGNTRTIAEMIQTKLGCSMLELTCAVPYPSEYQAVVAQAKEEKKKKIRPQIATTLPDFNNCDVIFLGYPNWWGTMPMLFFTLLEAHPMAGKIIAPFCTHGGSAFGSSVTDIKRLCPKARLIKGLAVHGSDVAKAQGKVDSWLSELGLLAKK